MQSFILQVLRVVAATIIGRAIVGLLNILGYHPEVWLAFKVAQLYPAVSFTSVLWFIAGVLALVVYVLEVRFNLVENISFFKNIPLSEAAIRAYDNLRTQGNSRHVREADINCETEEEKLNYFATAISTCTDIYGTHPPATTMELIEEKYYLACNFQNSGNVLRYHDNIKNAYENCSVRGSTLKKAIKALSGWTI